MKAYSQKGSIHGKISVPGSKSHTIRGVLIGTMAQGISHVKNPLTSDDCKSSLKVAEAFGAKCEIKDTEWIIHGTGGKLKLPDDVVDCGNSGTAIYFATAMAGTIDGTTVLTGDYQIRRRPIRTLLTAMNDLGATAYTTRPDVNAAPVVVNGSMKAGTAHFDGMLSQYVSGLLLASPLLEGTTTIKVEDPQEKPYVQMTLDWMTRQGIKHERTEDYKTITITGVQNYKAVNSAVPSDWSGVAFPLVAAVITNSELEIHDLDESGSQGDEKVVDVLIKMGADITRDKERNCLVIKGGKPLHGIDEPISLSDMPDSLPALSVAASYANGGTKFVGLKSVRLKETDRVAVMKTELTKMGAELLEGEDYLIVKGGKPLHGAVVNSHDDHRIAMSLCVAGLIADGVTEVQNAQAVSVSFPNFFEVMNNAGAGFKTE